MTDPLSFVAALFAGGIVAVFIEALRWRNVPAAVNALVSLLVTAIPLLVEFVARFRYDQVVGFGPELYLWIAAVGFVHSVGMLGPYDTIWWWDHLAHIAAASLVAVLFFTGLVIAVEHAYVPTLSLAAIGFLTVLFTFVAGVFWELIELIAREVGRNYDVEPVLVNYGRRDTAFDLVFDVLGAVVIVLLEVRFLVPIADRFPRTTVVLLAASGAVIVVGSALLALVALVSLNRRT